MPQDDYDHLLWQCDINFVRGEDSFVRAQWAGKPFISVNMGGLPEGAALATPGFRLPARWVIHTVAPRWYAPGREEEKIATLRACYSACLTTAAEIGAEAIAFPAIGTGIYGWPKELACETAVSVIRAHPAPIARVVFCCFTAEDARIYEDVIGRRAPR